MPGSGRPDFTGQRLLVSLDSHGFAQAVIERIQKQGGAVVTLGTENADVIADLSDLDRLQEAIEAFAESKPGITGVIHLAGLDAYFERKIARSLQIRM